MSRQNIHSAQKPVLIFREVAPAHFNRMIGVGLSSFDAVIFEDRIVKVWLKSEQLNVLLGGQVQGSKERIRPLGEVSLNHVEVEISPLLFLESAGQSVILICPSHLQQPAWGTKMNYPIHCSFIFYQILVNLRRALPRVN